MCLYWRFDGICTYIHGSHGSQINANLFHPNEILPYVPWQSVCNLIIFFDEMLIQSVYTLYTAYYESVYEGLLTVMISATP